MTAEYRCISPALCDSILVFVEATNESSTEFAGCIVTGLAWNYKPSDSLSAAYASRIDSIEASGGHVCRWHPISIRLGAGLPDDGFNCRELFLVPGEAFLDTLATRTGARDFQEYPGTLDASLVARAGPWVGAPAIGDVDGDGRVEIVAADSAGGLWAWHGSDLTEVFDGDADSTTLGLLRRLDPMLAPPMLFQADGDPGLEIAVVVRTAGGIAVHLLDGGSGLDQDPLFGGGWPRPLPGTLCSNLALARDRISTTTLVTGLYAVTGGGPT
ncbi:MAG: hypothetical protein ACE5E4_12895, partial [Candidatus Binatia bacterium]